jgi:cytochrome P450
LYKEYGYIVHYRVPTQDFILLSRINDLPHMFTTEAFLSRPSLDFFGETYGRMSGLGGHKKADGMTSATGEGWKIRREIANQKIVPLFPSYLEEVTKNVKDLTSNIAKHLGEEYDPYDDIRRNIFDSLATKGYGTAWTTQKKSFQDTIYESFKTWLANFPFDTSLSYSLHTALDKIAAWQAPVLRHRRETGEWENDWLSTFATTTVFNKTLKDEEVLATTIDFLAGGNTVAIQVVFGLYLLAKNPEVADRCREEVINVLGHGPITLANVHKLPYLSATMKEIERYESGGGRVGLGRTTLRNEVLETYQLEAGVNVLVNVHAIHHNKRYYKEPDVFKPERWLAKEEELPPPHAFLTFGLGIRDCPGKDLAHTIEMVQIAEILRDFKFSTSSPFEPMQALGAQLKSPVKFRFLKETFSSTIGSYPDNKEEL